jgi:hypothetical protein
MAILLAPVTSQSLMARKNRSRPVMLLNDPLPSFFSMALVKK